MTDQPARRVALDLESLTESELANRIDDHIAEWDCLMAEAYRRYPALQPKIVWRARHD
jgi:hypothetical protein